jgi:hypothetical protein
MSMTSGHLAMPVCAVCIDVLNNLVGRAVHFIL